MKIGIFTEGGKGIGNGHLSRTTALADGFEKLNCEVQFFIRGEEVSYPFKRPYQITYVEWAEYGVAELNERDHDIRIVDSYAARLPYSESSDNLQTLTVNLVDSVDGVKGGKFFLYPSVTAEKVEEFNDPERKFLGGKKYLLFTREFWNQPKVNPEERIGKIGISLGSLTGTYLSDIVGCIREMDVEQVKIVVLGEVESGRADVANEIEFTGQLSKTDYIERILELDLLITNGGQSLNEAILLGLPTLSLICTDNQVKNVETWTQCGCTLGMDARNRIDKENFKNRFQNLSRNQTRKEISHNCQAEVDHLGAVRAAKGILDWMTELRR